MRRKCICLVVVFNLAASASSLAQKEGYVWYFPRGLGLDFNTVPPTLLVDGQIDMGELEGGTEGCGSIASGNGELLFYANGKHIWNRKHEIMRNGDGLMGDVSSTSGAVIVPMPGNNAKYYVFTTGGFQYTPPVKVGYSIVDMCGDNGYGEVILQTKNTLLIEGTDERLAATRHANGADYWLVAHKQFSNAFYAYLITANGISEPVISEIGITHGNVVDGDDWDAIGQMKISPDGSKLALVMENRSPDVIELFNFDNTSGILTNYKNLSDGAASGGIYGVAFSADQSRLYVNGRSGLYQFSLDAGAGSQEEIKASKYQLANTNFSTGGLQLGPDGKIYVIRGFHAGVIQNPNVAGVACNYVEDAIDFGGRFVNFAFPAFLDNFEYPAKQSQPFDGTLADTLTGCASQPMDLREYLPADNLTFLWEDGSNGPVYEFPGPGEYKVTVSDGFCSADKEIFVPPAFDPLGADTTACEGDTVLLVSQVPDASYEWDNGSHDISAVVNMPGTYHLTVTKDNCSATDSIKVSYKPRPVFSLGNDTTLCNGDIMRLIISAQAEHYEWQDGNTRDGYNVTAPGEYSATATRGECSYYDEIRIDYNMKHVELGNDTVLCEGSALDLELDPQLSYQWNDGGTGSSRVIAKAEDVWVNARADNCLSTDTMRVAFVNCALQLPNFFSPNGDEYNAVFVPTEISGVTSAQLSIFNRWGRELYRTNAFSILKGWDGTYRKEPVPSGVYFWNVRYTDIEKAVHTLKGTVTLCR